MIRKKLLKATVITTVIATLLTSAACSNKSTSNSTTDTKETVSSETQNIANKELTNTSLVTFNYTDKDGNTYTLEGKAIANESGDATIEVEDSNGNKVTFTGTATITDGKMSVTNITVKDEGILVKSDGSKINVTTESSIENANEGTENDNVSDIVATDEIKNEIITAKKEEATIQAEKEKTTKNEYNANSNQDTIISDNSNSNGLVSFEPDMDTIAESPAESIADNTTYSPTISSTTQVTESTTTPETEPTAPVEPTPTEKPDESPKDLIISGYTSLNGVTINNDVYITYNGTAVFKNVTINGDIYCYGTLICSSTTARNVNAYYAYDGMFSCSNYDGTHGNISGELNCNSLYIADDALDYAFSKWGKY